MNQLDRIVKKREQRKNICVLTARFYIVLAGRRVPLQTKVIGGVR